MHWTNPKRAVHCLLLAAALAAGACSSNETGSNAGGSGGTGGRGGAGGTGGGGATGGSSAGTGGGSGGSAGGSGGQTDAPGPQAETGGPMGPPKLCAEIRNCIFRCTDPACAQACVDQAPAPAKAKYDQVLACSKAGCAQDDINCRCARECLEEGACVAMVDECREGVDDDLYCDEQCH